MHYMKWTKTMLPEVSEEFELVCIVQNKSGSET